MSLSELVSREAEDAWTLILNYLNLSGWASALSNAFKKEEPIEWGKGEEDDVYFIGEESVDCLSFFEKRIIFLLWSDAAVVIFDIVELAPFAWEIDLSGILKLWPICFAFIYVSIQKYHFKINS